jgi:hypothetical protein
MNAQTTLTEDSAKLFTAVVKDLMNWGDTTPCFNHLTAQTRGNLTDLKKRGLVTTFKSDGEEWIELTPAGVAHAMEIGLSDHIPASLKPKPEVA